MYLSKDREQAPKSSKKIVLAALAGVAVVGVATVAYNNTVDNMDFEQFAEFDETMELSAADVAISNKYYSQVAGPCNHWYVETSKTFDKGQLAFTPPAKFLYENRNFLTRYGSTGYHAVMGSMIDIVDDLTQAQRELESVYLYSTKQMRLMSKAIPRNKWKVLLKYQTRIGKKCLAGEHELEQRMQSLNDKYQQLGNAFHTMGSMIVRNANSDYSKWDCEKMYPMPEQFKVDVKELILGTIKKGFEIFNQVKGMLPAGAMKNLKIPGLPAGMTDKIGSAIGKFNDVRGQFN